MNFNAKQIKILSSFLNDISKALMIAVILGQGYIPTNNIYDKVYVNVFWFCMSIFFIILAMIISRHYDRSK